MFSSRNKLDKNLKYYLSNKSYKKYRILIKCKNFRDGVSKKVLSYRGEVIHSLEYSDIVCASLDGPSIERLIEYPEVQHICFDEYLFLCGMSVSTANKVHISEKYSLSGKGIGIGLVDSGVYPHPDLLNPSNRIANFVDLINELRFPYDDNGHGTCISGLISSSGISSNNMYKGIAPHAQIHCYKAFDKLGKGYASNVLFAIEELIRNSEINNIKVLCLPFELLTHNIQVIEAFNSTFLKANEIGIVPIVPSGSNSNVNNSIMGIATLDTCITVAGVDTALSLKPYKYSSAGPYSKSNKPNLSAACVNITSLNADTAYISEKEGFKLYPTKLEASYKTFSGTSLSTAFISGICALLYENNPSLSFKDISSILKLSCELGEFSKFQQGEGVINISKLLN
ncbi:S8 family serine peptidase [Clostridium paraputrificum]|uniref:S8 family serine peptidase n=1 Tax=Clostridium TaxID=1485 RepID=UPI003D32FFF0